MRTADSITIIKKLIDDNNGILRTEEAGRAGISRTTLGLLVKKGIIERIAHGQYINPNDLPDELFLLQLRSEKIVFSHETALYLHDMAERTPNKHSLTIPSECKLSSVISEQCKIYYVKSEYHSLGKCPVVSKMGNELIAYDAERTVCDILRSRNRIDSQTFAAAIRNYIERNNQDWKKLSYYAECFCITKLLRQYLEVLL